MIARIEADIKSAMLAGDNQTVSTLRMLKSALNNAQIEKGGELTEQDVVGVLRKQAKQRRESIESYRQAGRESQAEAEAEELEIIEAYLPQSMNEAELTAIIEQAIEETGATSAADIGAVMRTVQPKVAGRAEGGEIAAIVRKKLQ